MRELKKLIHDIHRGKNLESNLKRYREAAVRIYNDYGALELTFSAFTMLQEIMEEKSELAAKEEKVIERICKALGGLGEENCRFADWIPVMEALRQEITDKMDLFTAYTDRLICYEYVLNRMELKFLPEKELKKRLEEIDDEEFLQRIMAYLFGSKDQSVIQEKVQMVIGQIPVHMTKNKLFEKISEAMTLYKDGDKTSVENFIYMLRTSAMVYEPGKSPGEYPEFEEALDRLEKADYDAIEEAEYERLVEVLEKSAKAIHEITDFYYSMQKVVNGIYALCLSMPYLEEETKLIRAIKSIWRCYAGKEYREEMLIPLEGRIEDCVEKTSYLEAVLFEIKSSYKKELSQWEMTSFFEDFSRVANLLSDSLFIDLEQAAKEEKADSTYIRQRSEELFEELSAKFSQVSRPVRGAIMGQILEKLPALFQNTDEVQEYIRVNLLGCQNKAQKCVVMEILWDLIQEEQEW
ncbi:MAG: hypothetical protein J1F22_06620 [Lachnospiraceae bacterium]|nr:hypothetical protein [Lachnospiraceae bacterium]